MERVVKDSARAAGIDDPLEVLWADAFEQDWEAQVRASYVPIQLLAGVWVVPDWCDFTSAPCLEIPRSISQERHLVLNPVSNMRLVCSCISTNWLQVLLDGTAVVSSFATLGPLNCALEIFLGYASLSLMDLFTPQI
jgi:hypothetical protein